MEHDIIHKSGAWFSYNDQRIAQGRDNCRIYLREHPDVFDEIDQKVRAFLFSDEGKDAASKLAPEGDMPVLEDEEEENEDDLLSLIDDEEET